MTTENDFQAKLDANPEDWQSRLVFADWLDEHAGEIAVLCPRCGGSKEADAYMWAGKHDQDLRKTPIGKQPCHMCEDEDGNPTGLLTIPDPRAEGYRALGVLRLRPQISRFGGRRAARTKQCYGFTKQDNDSESALTTAQLPLDWFNAIPQPPHTDNPWWRWLDSRCEAEDAAALAFAKLPPERRAQLLAMEVPNE